MSVAKLKCPRCAGTISVDKNTTADEVACPHCKAKFKLKHKSKKAPASPTAAKPTATPASPASFSAPASDDAPVESALPDRTHKIEAPADDDVDDYRLADDGPATNTALLPTGGVVDVTGDSGALTPLSSKAGAAVPLEPTRKAARRGKKNRKNLVPLVLAGAGGGALLLMAGCCGVVLLMMGGGKEVEGTVEVESASSAQAAVISSSAPDQPRLSVEASSAAAAQPQVASAATGAGASQSNVSQSSASQSNKPRNLSDKPFEMPEGYEVVVAEWRAPERLSSIELLAEAAPAENWSVELPDGKPPQNLASAWVVPQEVIPESTKSLTVLPAASGLLAAVLAEPTSDEPAVWLTLDLTKSSRPTAVTPLSPEEESAPRAAGGLSLEDRRRLARDRGALLQNRAALAGQIQAAGVGQQIGSLSPSGAKLASALQDSSAVHVWASNGDYLTKIDAPPGGQWVAVRFVDEQLLCLLSDGGALQTVNVARGQTVKEAEVAWRGKVAFSPGGRYLVGFDGAALEFRDTRRLEPAGKLPLPPRLANQENVEGPALHISADGRRLAALFHVPGEKAFYNNLALLTWDLSNGRPTDVFLRRRSGNERMWVQWVGERRVLIHSGSEDTQCAVVDLDRSVIVYMAGGSAPLVHSVDDRVWRFGAADDIASAVYEQAGQPAAPEAASSAAPEGPENFRERARERSRRGTEAPKYFVAGAAVPEKVEQYVANLSGLPVNRNIPVRLEVAGKKHWPLAETAAGFAQVLAKYGYTVDPQSSVVYRIVLTGYSNVDINTTGFTVGTRDRAGVRFSARLDLGDASHDRYIGPEICSGAVPISENPRVASPGSVGADEWESRFPEATQKARERFLESLQAKIEGRSGGGIGSISTTGEFGTYYVPHKSQGMYEIPEPRTEGDFPIDGIHQPDVKHITDA